MPTKTQTAYKHLINEDITSVDTSAFGDDILLRINHQIKQTQLTNTNQLQTLQTGLYLLTISKPHISDPLRIKKLSDRAQYSTLPAQYGAGVYAKITRSQFANLGHGTSPSLASHAYNFLKGRLPCHVIFFFQPDYIEKLLLEQMPVGVFVNEVLTNRMIMLSNGEFVYPLCAKKLAALAIWRNMSLDKTVSHELAMLAHRFRLLPILLTALQQHFSDHEWTLTNGKMQITHQGVTKSFDYASLLEDIISAKHEHAIPSYLKHFRVNDLDTISSFPTVSVRSLVHMRARPQSLSSMGNGYAVAAAVESGGKQTPIYFMDQVSPQRFSLWMNRAVRNLYRHHYRARVVFPPENSHSAFSLVGEQVATIALFPALVKGIFEALNLDTPTSVRLIAHNEDVLTVAHDTASWVDINEVNQRATSLFRLVAIDGADPLSLFEQVVLPHVGVGTFQLKEVPESFFELVSTAQSMSLSSQNGHDHYLLGLAYECLHEWGLAVTEFQKALRFDATDPDVLHALGCALMEIGNIEESLPFLKRAFELMPEDPEVANDWGRSNLECGYLPDAISAFERAVRLSPGSADYLKNLGHGYLLAARPQDALSELNKAIKCDPHSAEAHASLAHLYLASGNETAARKHALIAYNENPVDANIANMLWRLTLGKK